MFLKLTINRYLFHLVPLSLKHSYHFRKLLVQIELLPIAGATTANAQYLGNGVLHLGESIFNLGELSLKDVNNALFLVVLLL